jgi:hypothetical protein
VRKKGEPESPPLFPWEYHPALLFSIRNIVNARDVLSGLNPIAILDGPESVEHFMVNGLRRWPNIRNENLFNGV